MSSKYDVSDNGTFGPDEHPGGDLFVQIAGAQNYGGGSVVVQADLGSGFVGHWTFDDSSEQGRIFHFPQKCRYQFVVAGATSPDLSIDHQLHSKVTGRTP